MGCELDKDYFNAAKARFEQATAQIAVTSRRRGIQRDSASNSMLLNAEEAKKMLEDAIDMAVKHEATMKKLDTAYEAVRKELDFACVNSRLGQREGLMLWQF